MSGGRPRIGHASDAAGATTQSGRHQNIPFRLQYTWQPGAVFGSGEKISYSAGGMASVLKIDQVKALLADLQKQGGRLRS